MSDATEVRAMEIATKLVLGPLAGESISSVNAIGELLSAMTERGLEAVEKGERWGQRQSRRLTVPEARKVLRAMSIDQMEAFAERWGYCIHEMFEWSVEQRDIHPGALWALGDQGEMAKITGGER